MAKTLTRFFSGAHQLALDRSTSSIGQHAIKQYGSISFFLLKILLLVRELDLKKKKKKTEMFKQLQQQRIQ
jgi:hypothetical protein